MQKDFDLIIIGGGAAGVMAAISARKHYPGYEIAIVEKNVLIGRKILICGAGRCNLTNIELSTERFYGASAGFAGSIINQFPSQSIRAFFKELGVEMYEEVKNGRRKGKIFPVTNQAVTITELLKSELERLDIKLILNSEVEDIVVENDRFIVNVKANTNEVIEDYKRDLIPKGFTGQIASHKLILSSGGKTYPRLGATGFGYEMAQKLGHSLVAPVPSALPLQIKDDLVTQLAGVRCDVEVTSIINGQSIKTDSDEILFTKYGLSGPVILNISREVSVRLNREQINDAFLKINFFPGKTSDQVSHILADRWFERSDQQLKYSLYGLLPNKIVDLVLRSLKLDGTRKVAGLNRNEKNQIVEKLVNWKLKVSATKGWEDGEFTAGGINTKEIKAESLESKIIPNLYFAGEVVNVDGDVGGFNLSWAWCSGFVAGKLG